MPPLVEVFENRLIAFLDVLGFSQRLASETPAGVVEMYCGFIDEANKKVFSQKNHFDEVTPLSNFAASKFVFDSIVLVSHPISDPRNISNFIFATTLLLESGFTAKFPLRGAISIGDYVESVSNGVFVSEEFKNLFSCEQNIDWSGCCVLKKAESIVLAGLYGSVPAPLPENIRGNMPVIYCEVPIKDRQRIAELNDWMWALNWCHMLSDGEIDLGLAHLIPEKRIPTVKFLRRVRSLDGCSRQLVQGHFPPLYIRSMPSTTQCRIRFTNENDEPAEPQMEIQIAFEAEL